MRSRTRGSSGRTTSTSGGNLRARRCWSRMCATDWASFPNPPLTARIRKPNRGAKSPPQRWQCRRASLGRHRRTPPRGRPGPCLLKYARADFYRCTRLPVSRPLRPVLHVASDYRGHRIRSDCHRCRWGDSKSLHLQPGSRCTAPPTHRVNTGTREHSSSHRRLHELQLA